MMRTLIELPRWLLLLALVEAPWLYGSVRDWTLDIFNWLLLSIVILWLGGCVARKLKPQVNPVLLGCAGFLFIQGWFMVINAQYFYDRERLQFIPIVCLWRSGPGVLDRVDAVPMMLRFTGLLGVMCFVSDLVQRPKWRQRIWRTIGATGGALMLFGVFRDIMGLKLHGEDPTVIGETSFATYFYHANAGAYINLVLPLVAGLTITAFDRRGTTAQRSIWTPALVLCVAGAVAAVSKAAMVIAALIIFFLALWRGYQFAVSKSASRSRTLLFVLGAILSFAIAAAFGWDAASRRWSEIPTLLNKDNPRLLAWQPCLRMLADGGAWGIGPGNFAIAFPHYTGFLGSRIEGLWRFAHNDYLQTAIEWGWVGAMIWSLLLFGGIAQNLWSYVKKKSNFSRADGVFLFTTMLALLGVVLHATVDFPLQIASLQLYVAVYLGISWGSPYWRR